MPAGPRPHARLYPQLGSAPISNRTKMTRRIVPSDILGPPVQQVRRLGLDQVRLFNPLPVRVRGGSRIPQGSGNYLSPWAKPLMPPTPSSAAPGVCIHFGSPGMRLLGHTPPFTRSIQKQIGRSSVDSVRFGTCQSSCVLSDQMRGEGARQIGRAPFVAANRKKQRLTLLCDRDPHFFTAVEHVTRSRFQCFLRRLDDEVTTSIFFRDLE